MRQAQAAASIAAFVALVLSEGVIDFEFVSAVVVLLQVAVVILT